RLMQILAQTGATIEPMSIDEAYMDLSAVMQSLAQTEIEQIDSHDQADTMLELSLPVAREIKEKIRNERRLTATIGVAPNKLLAKLASDFKNPDGLTLVRDRDKLDFLRP